MEVGIIKQRLNPGQAHTLLTNIAAVLGPNLEVFGVNLNLLLGE